MSTEERLSLIRALIAASNAFHDTLKENGYSVSYGLDNTKRGSIRKIDVPLHESWSLSELTISWELKK